MHALADDRLAKRTALVLALAQAFGGAVSSINVAAGGLTGIYLLGPGTPLATLPISLMIVGTACGTVPAALLMRRIGRRAGFLTGASLGAVGGLVSAGAVLEGVFGLYCLGTLVTGLSVAFVQQYRFAAADAASDSFRPKAISWVLAGGIAAGVIGPQTVIWTKDLFDPILFAGAFLGQACLCLVAMLVLCFLARGGPVHAPAVGARRSLGAILRHPRVAVAILCGIVSYAMMSFVMTAAPLAMVGCGLTTGEATLGIQWHVIAMYGPSFVTGSLITRFGAERVAGVGLLLLTAAGATALAGVQLANFWLALILLGLGWNFGFIGATAMLTREQRPEERARLQAANDLLVFGTVAIASLSSGGVFAGFGWATIPSVLIAVAGLAFVALLVASLLPRLKLRSA